MREKKEDHHVYRLPPCPAYDVEGMESWLTDMAGRGLVLVEDGIFAGAGVFKRGGSENMKYRLEAAPKSTSMWAEDMGEPDPEAAALNGKYGWKYVAKRGEFYIYAASKQGARELNTDPAVQALTLTAVKKRRIAATFQLFFWLILYSALQIRDTFILTMIQTGTWLFLLGAFIVCWISGEALAEVIYLGRLQKKLFAGASLDHKKDWRKRTGFYYGKKCLRMVLICVWLFCLLDRWNTHVLGEDKMRLEDYQGELPFADMEDLAGEGEYRFQRTRLGDEWDYVKEWSDWLAPVNMTWREHGAITWEDGITVTGGLYVDYHETISPQIAEWLAMEYYRYDMRGKDSALLETPALAADYAAVYLNDVHFPTVVIQEDAIVIHVTFYQNYSEQRQIPLEEWVEIVAEKCGECQNR